MIPSVCPANTRLAPSIVPISDVTTPPRSIQEQFKASFSWDHYFSNASNGVIFRPLTTDIEPDDILLIVKMAQNLDRYYRTNPSEKPFIQLIASEGDEATLEKKIATTKKLLCRMAADQIVCEDILSFFSFAKGTPTAFESADKAQGYENIYQAALRLVNEGTEALENKYFSSAPTTADALYNEWEKIQQQTKIAIREISLAPVDNMLQHYQNHPSLVSSVETATLYGSFNFEKAQKRGRKAADLERALGQFPLVFDFEVHLATRYVENSNKATGAWSDHSKIGNFAHPHLFAPLLAKNASVLQKFVLQVHQGWSEPLLNKFLNEIADGDVKESSKDPNYKSLIPGKEFITEFRSLVARDKNYTSSLNLLKQYAAKRFPEDSVMQNKMVSGWQKKVHIAHSMLVNDCIQGALADFFLSMVLEDPALIEPSCLFRSNIRINPDDKRTVFQPADQGNAFSIQSRQDQIGVKMELVHQNVVNFFQALQPSPVSVPSAWDASFPIRV